MKELRPIRNEKEYAEVLAEVSAFVDNEPKRGTKDADRFELLLMLVEAYEAKHYSIAPPDPIEAIKYRMEQAGLKPKDLQPMIGGLNRVYEILNRKRPLTLKMIWKLHSMLGIPADSLIQQDDELHAT
jgi:HTH-type transcriptional regulator / antitoxin HigA